MNNIDAIALQLNGTKYPVRIPAAVRDQAKAARIVIVYGASDDLMEFDGAIRDEVGCYDGGTAYLTPRGLLANKCEDHDCPYFAREKEEAATIEAIWGQGAYSWTYRTEIPHATFEVSEDGQPYCKGIVFALSDVGTTPDRAP